MDTKTAGIASQAQKVGTQTQGETPSMRDFNTLFGVVIGVAVVCFLAFLSLLISYFTQTQGTFQSLKDSVVEQNAKVDVLKDKIEMLEFEIRQQNRKQESTPSTSEQSKNKTVSDTL